MVVLYSDGSPFWLDARAGDQVRRLGDSRTHRLSGKPLPTTPTLCKLAWLSENEPATLASTRYVTDVHDYLSRCLTGRFVTSVASADPMGLMELARSDWSEELLARVNLRREMMPELVDAGTMIGGLRSTAAELTGLQAGLPVVAGAGDGQWEGLRSGITSGGTAYLSPGTSITVGAHSEDLATPSLAYRVLGSPLASGSTFEGYAASGAFPIFWFRNTFLDSAGDNIFEVEIAVASIERGVRGLMFLPHLGGAGTPHWDDRSRLASIGIDEGHEKFEFLRAVLEGLAFELSLVLEGIESSTGPAHEVVRARLSFCRDCLVHLLRLTAPRAS